MAFGALPASASRRQRTSLHISKPSRRMWCILAMRTLPPPFRGWTVRSYTPSVMGEAARCSQTSDASQVVSGVREQTVWAGRAGDHSSIGVPFSSMRRHPKIGTASMT